VSALFQPGADETGGPLLTVDPEALTRRTSASISLL
jgi:hypothetical protein